MLRRLSKLWRRRAQTYEEFSKQGFTVFEPYNSVGGSAKFVSSLRPVLVLMMAYIGYGMLLVKCETEPEEYRQERLLLLRARKFLFELYDV